MVQAEVKPTETVEKVTRALRNIATGPVESRLDGAEFLLQMETTKLESLDHFKIILRRDQIRAAARAVMTRGITGDSLEFYLNKQVAHAGHVSFSLAEGESPLGPIHITITSPSIERVVEWLTE